MSCDSLAVNEESVKTGAIVTYRQLEENSNYIIRHISSSFVQIQQLKTELNEQHKYEKHELVELNEKLQLLVNHTQKLELENSKLVTKLIDLRQSLLTNAISKETDQHNRLQAAMLQIYSDKNSFESDIELFQLESQIYQQMIQVQQQSVDDEKLKLEQLLKQSTSDLADLRASCVTMEQNVRSVRATRENTFQKYMALAKELSLLRKQTNEYKVNLQMIKTQIKFSKVSTVKLDFDSLDMSDFTESWKLEWARIITKIRHDFEVLYQAAHQETIYFYENKAEELELELAQIAEYRKIEESNYTKIIEQIHHEYEDLQKIHSYESGVLVKSEELCSQLESDLRAIQIQNEELFEVQSNDSSSLYESIIVMTNSIKEMQRKRICLETEIIIYRHILGQKSTQETIQTALTQTRKFSIEVLCRGPINIGCPLDGTHIKLINQSASSIINISKWQLKRWVDSKIALQYTLPDGVQLQPGNELRIYSKLGNEVAQASLKEDDVSSILYQQLVLSDVYSIGIGEKIETSLLDENGEVKASCVQSMIPQ